MNFVISFIKCLLLPNTLNDVHTIQLSHNFSLKSLIYFKKYNEGAKVKIIKSQFGILWRLGSYIGPFYASPWLL